MMYVYTMYSVCTLYIYIYIYVWEYTVHTLYICSCRPDPRRSSESFTRRMQSARYGVCSVELRLRETQIEVPL